MGRFYRIIHEPYLNEYLVRNYPIGTWIHNVRVGPVAPELVAEILEERLRRVARVTVASVDAIVKLPDKTVLVEAMIRDEPGKVQMLKLYRRLFLSDTEFRDRWELPVELVLVTPIFNPLLRAICQEEGITYAFYRPDWIEPYLGSLPPRLREPRLQGVKWG